MAVLTHGDLPRGEMGGIISNGAMARAMPRARAALFAVGDGSTIFISCKLKCAEGATMQIAQESSEKAKKTFGFR
jgi:hypothetical protein